MFVGDQREVLGVWVADDHITATKQQLQLTLTYPDCETIAEDADDYETLKEGYADYEFGDLEPDKVYLT